MEHTSKNSLGKDPKTVKRTDIYNINFEKIGNSKENIKLIHNFVDPLICDKLLASKGDPIKESGWWEGRTFINSDIIILAWGFRDKIKNFIESKYDISLSDSIPGQGLPTPAIASWQAGHDMELHVDDLTKVDYHMSALIYLNDDFIGGEIEFPEQDVKIKPTKGDLIVFPGNINYAHKVGPIISGERYTMPFWFRYQE